MPDMTPPAVPSAPAAPTGEPEIQVIPEKFYGAALKARVPETPKPAEQQLVQPKRSNALMIALIVIVLLVGIGGAFVYFNRELLFGKPSTPPPVAEAPKPTPPTQPSAPTGFAATSTSPQSASLAWTDTASNESGYRIERADRDGVLIPLTNVSPNSTSFLDTSVQPGSAYRYRVVAVNEGGEAPSSEVAVDVQPLPPPPPEQPKLPPAGLDTDSDGLTDLEEVLFASGLRNPDTDGDGFLDGNEVFHLYNPNGRAPARLLDAGLVKEYQGTIGWTLQVPTPWSVVLDAIDGSRATITTGHDEVFRVSIEENPKQLAVLDWYLEKNPNVRREQILEYRSKRGYSGIIGTDLLTTYIPWGDKVFVYTYDIDGQPFINFRTSYAMMLNSLELKGVPQVSATGITPPLPFEPAAKETGVVTQPTPVAPTPPPPAPPVPATTTAP